MADEFAMVLAGGGAKGAYQVGVFKALKEYPLKIKCVSGSSVGGINAFAYAALSQEEIEHLWKNFGLEDFINLDDDWSDGLSDRAALENILEKIVDPQQLKYSIPVYNTICREGKVADYVLLNGLDKDMVVKTILATSALPFIYSSVNIEGVQYQDGGLADNLPVQPLYDIGCRDMLIVSLSETQRVDRKRFELDNVVEIYPSRSLGDFVDGVVNFTAAYISFAMKLGYMDAKRSLNSFYNIDNGCHTTDFDYEYIMQELRMEKLQNSVNRNMDGIMKYFD